MDRRIAQRYSNYTGPKPGTQSRAERREEQRTKKMSETNKALLRLLREESEQVAQSNARIALWPDWVRAVVYGAAGRELQNEDDKEGIKPGTGEVKWAGMMIQHIHLVSQRVEKPVPKDLNAMDIIRVLRRELASKVKGKEFKKPKSSDKSPAGATHLRHWSMIRADYKDQPGNRVKT